MKKIFLIVFCTSMIVACSTTPEEVKEDCLKDKTLGIFYGEKTAEYCDCVYRKLKILSDSVNLKKEIIDSVKIECDMEYTTLDTEF